MIDGKNGPLAKIGLPQKADRLLKQSRKGVSAKN
jgi:hypothetical protein